MRPAILLIALTLGLGPASLARAAGDYPQVCGGGTPAMMPMDHAQGAPMKDHQQANMQGMMTMNRDMAQGMMKDDADVAFVCGMIAHHQGAIAMAEVELKYGDDDWARQMAQSIIAAQTKEIAAMTEWLRKNAK